MAVVSRLASPINIKGVSKSVSTAKKSLNQTTNSFKQISEILVKKTKVRRQIFDDTLETKRKRENYTIRKEEEDRLEAPNAVKSGDPSQVLPLIQSSGRSFFGRIISTLGYLAAGWVLRNLPTWVALGREFIVRVEKAGDIIKNFVKNTINVFTSTYQVLDGFRKNIMTFDLFDDSNRVKNSFDELKTSIDNMGIELENAIKLVTTPLTQTTADGTQVGTYSGEEVPGLGTTSQDNGAYAGEETSGGTVSSQAVYSYLKSKGMSHNHALGITANILGESGFKIGAQEKGDSKSGVGLFQYSNVRKPAFLKAVPDYKKNWKAQIDYAINEDRAPEYLKTQFSSPEEAAYWWMNKWERPAARVYTGRNKKHNDFIKSFKPGISQSQPQKAISSTGNASASLAQAAQSLKGMSSASGPDGGNLACVWAVNQVFKKAGLKTPWGDSNNVPRAEEMMIKAGYTRIPMGQQKAGDLYIVHGQAHIGIVLANGNIISNSSSGAKFSWEASLSSYQKTYGGAGRFYRIPGGTTSSQQSQNANLTSSNLQSASILVKKTEGTADTGAGYNPDNQFDYKNRPIVLSQSAANAFSAMLKDSGGKVKGSDVASSQRSAAKNASLPGAAKNSNHLRGDALDLSGSSAQWMKVYGKKYGWHYLYDHGPGSSHFDYKGSGSPSNLSAQVSAAPTSANPSTPAPYPAQISPTFAQQNQQQVAQQITPERRGQDVVAIIPQQQAARSPQSAAPASSAGGGSSAPSMFDVLNNFMKQKLLLDLAYL